MNSDYGNVHKKNLASRNHSVHNIGRSKWEELERLVSHKQRKPKQSQPKQSQSKQSDSFSNKYKYYKDFLVAFKDRQNKSTSKQREVSKDPKPNNITVKDFSHSKIVIINYKNCKGRVSKPKTAEKGK